MNDLTPRQAEVLEFIRSHIAEHGYPPSFREMCESLSIGSPNGITGHLKALEKKGYIKRPYNRARALQVLQ